MTEAQVCVVLDCGAPVRSDNLAYCHQHMEEAKLRRDALLSAAGRGAGECGPAANGLAVAAARRVLFATNGWTTAAAAELRRGGWDDEDIWPAVHAARDTIEPRADAPSPKNDEGRPE